MSLANSNNYFYQLSGRVLHLYKLQDAFGSALTFPDQLGRFGESISGIIYPDDDITDGLKIEYTRLPTDLFVDEDPRSTAQASLTAQSTPDEDAFLNVSRMLALAVVDYVEAMLAKRAGDEGKYRDRMRDFWKKVSDEESNKARVHRVLPNRTLNLV